MSEQRAAQAVTPPRKVLLPLVPWRLAFACGPYTPWLVPRHELRTTQNRLTTNDVREIQKKNSQALSRPTGSDHGKPARPLSLAQVESQAAVVGRHVATAGGQVELLNNRDSHATVTQLSSGAGAVRAGREVALAVLETPTRPGAHRVRRPGVRPLPPPRSDNPTERMWLPR